MRIYYHPDQACHAPKSFLLRGQLTPSPEGPVRAEILLDALSGAGFSVSTHVPECGLEPLRQVHSDRYLRFLQTIHGRWQALPGGTDIVMPNVHPVGGGRRYPDHPVGQAGWHMHDMACPLGADSWTGIAASAASAVAAAEAVLDGGDHAYALCRPPGHHAGPERAGGFCFVNNTAVAAAHLRTRYARVAIVDVDLHHGNGTQDIFYNRGDIWTGSVHADTREFYPFYWGGADETGAGAGLGSNHNIPLPLGSTGREFIAALERLLEELESWQPQVLVIALGLDAHKDDPLAGLRLETEDFIPVGARLRALDLATVIVQEGGYPTQSLGRNLLSFLDGFNAET
ncbi:acetoin utilization deacetylase AcuC-like enzyme [Natronocella acetinitrilica]|uniref:Acetoin utilization deacetylase AcuC-like enzyme n=1 Tax=Natronocella acetinitrilica TaxID=414046 RepID=A0AAE3G2H4_9GAMM|nr:histone deacetylase family protein [Natronocella acetinitrilica]MCP1673511.1 acetoin utilization deacetylase AcuC-like enzyme [Natronocella acetinitrilica]